jgi:hypothetical protein
LEPDFAFAGTVSILTTTHKMIINDNAFFMKYLPLLYKVIDFVLAVIRRKPARGGSIFFAQSPTELNAKLTSGLNSAILFCQTYFWFGYFSAFFQLFFHVFGGIIKKNAWIFEYTKSAPRTHRCKSNFWMPLCMVIHFVSSCLFCFTSIT